MAEQLYLFEKCRYSQGEKIRGFTPKDIEWFLTKYEDDGLSLPNKPKKQSNLSVKTETSSRKETKKNVPIVSAMKRKRKLPPLAEKTCIPHK